MIIAIDVHYAKNNATIAGVTFNSCKDEQEIQVYISHIEGVEDYVSGEFYRRELPCILHLLNEHSLTPELIIVDGFVTLSNNKKGLGEYLFDALDGEVPIIGVAKNSFSGLSKDAEIYRGESKKPLYISSKGLALQKAKEKVQLMSGSYRIPYLLKKADSSCRKAAIT